MSKIMLKQHIFQKICPKLYFLAKEILIKYMPNASCCKYENEDNMGQWGIPRYHGNQMVKITHSVQ
jgi:hypothetical protein